MRVLYLKEGEVAIGRSLLQGRCQERVAIGGSWHLWRGRDREIAPTGEVSGERSPLGKVGIYGEVAIGRSLLQGRGQPPLGEVGISHRGGVRRGKSRSGDRSYRGGVRRESRHWGKLAFMEKSRSGDRSYRGGVRRESPSGEVSIGRSLLQGRCQERVAIGGSWHQGEVAIGRSLLQKT